MTNELPAYDNLPAKQSRWEVSVHNAARDVLGGFQRPSDKPPGMGRQRTVYQRFE